MERIDPLEVGSRFQLGSDHLPGFVPIVFGALVVFVLVVGIKYLRTRNQEFQIRSRAPEGWGRSSTTGSIRQRRGTPRASRPS